MAIYALYFYALVKLIPITLTLPGIAGLILTLGVAADANIVIFERVKEEMRAGRSVAQAISTGYKKGLTAIIDANIVTFLVAFILFILATAGVQGFAFTLGRRRHPLAVHRGARHPGDAVLAARHARCCARARRSGRASRSRSSSTSWASRSGSSRSRA